MVVKLSSFLSTSLAEGLDSALVTGIIAATDIALDSGTSGNYVAQITAGDGITVLNGAAHEATTIIKADSAVVATTDNTLTLTNKTLVRMNEVELTSSNFSSPRGIQSQGRTAVNEAIRYINQ